LRSLSGAEGNTPQGLFPAPFDSAQGAGNRLIFLARTEKSRTWRHFRESIRKLQVVSRQATQLKENSDGQAGKPKSLRLLGREEEAARVEAVMG